MAKREKPSARGGAVRRRLAEALLAARPGSAEALWRFVHVVYGLAVPRAAVCPGHVAPWTYVERAFLAPGRDLVVWACRGGAKTELGSVVAHLDAVFRPGCQTRILGGSLEQSERMYRYLLQKWDGACGGLLARPPTARRTELANGSVIEVLTQSERSVRGQRVHRLKCDEVDEFSPAVWQAAQFTTQSAPGRDGAWIASQMEAFSTMHRPFGPMARLVERIAQGESQRAPGTPRQRRETGGRAGGGGAARPKPGPSLLKWCLWEVIEKCPPDRACDRCPLWADCEGRARRADGYFPIDDAIAQRTRSSREAWEAEMLCVRPRADRLVFAEFDPAVHVAPVSFDASLPLYRALDFGYANPFVCLWIQLRGAAETVPSGPAAGVPGPPGTPGAAGATGDRDGPRAASLRDDRPGDVDLSRVQVRVLAEYVARQRPIADHARAMAELDPGPVLKTFADPAGWQRSDVTGTGPCQELSRLGIRVRTPRAGILEGIELMRRLLKPRGTGGGGPGLVVAPSCEWLVRALQEYHWSESPAGERSERPAKDGADHPIDALRYFAAGVFLRRGRVRERRW